MYYVIQVATGKEDKTMEDIRKISSDRPYFEVFSPYREELRKYKHGERLVKQRCFPGYLFVETDNIEQLFRDMYEIPDFTRLLGGDEHNRHFSPLSEDESRLIDILYNANNGRTTELSDITLEEGDQVKVLAGPLMFMDGRIKKIDLHKRKATVVISFFNKTIETNVGINIITKIRMQ